ncbi:MAG TPA: PIN domain-containing protein [Nitrososphaera sp.]
MTSVADTRLLLTLQFPVDEETAEKARAFFHKELAYGVILPSIVLTEFVKIAGARIGIQAALNSVNGLKERGMKVRPLDDELAIEAGRMLIKNRNVPIADSLVASFVSKKLAGYVLSDDPHFQTLGCKVRWF